MLIPITKNLNYNFSAPTENHPLIAHGSLNSIQKMILPFKNQYLNCHPGPGNSKGGSPADMLVEVPYIISTVYIISPEGLGEADDFPIAVSVFQMGSSVHHPLGQATYFQTGAPGSRQE
jgi:hypothetical protein